MRIRRKSGTNRRLAAPTILIGAVAVLLAAALTYAVSSSNGEPALLLVGMLAIIAFTAVAYDRFAGE